MGNRQGVKTDNKKHRLNLLPVQRLKVLHATPALYTPMGRWLSAPPCLGLLQQGSVLQPLHSAPSWCIWPKITSVPSCCAYTWCCTNSNTCGVTFPHMAISSFPSQQAVCLIDTPHNKVIWKQWWEECCTLSRAQQLHMVLSCLPPEAGIYDAKALLDTGM